MKQWYILLYYLRSVIFKIENVVNDNLPAISIWTCKQQHNFSDAYNLRIHTQGRVLQKNLRQSRKYFQPHGVIYKEQNLDRTIFIQLPRCSL